MIKVFSQHQDKVINSQYVTGQTTYETALKSIVPLMDKLAIQRKVQRPKFYERLSKDIVAGCIMPPLTLAFVDEQYNFDEEKSLKDIQSYVNKNLKNAFVLDGIQRLNTLKKASAQEGFDKDLPIFFNILICPSNDRLLYRMITLNNGQKPMTTRHQVEILLAYIFDFKDDSIEILSEKETNNKNSKVSFKKSSFINAYLAFLNNSINVDNKKIIEEKLDELLGLQIMDLGVKDNEVEFKDVISLISKFSVSINVRKWFQNENNLIGFSVAARNRECFDMLNNMDEETFEYTTIQFENAFEAIDKSKIRVGTYRRKVAAFFFENIKTIQEKDYEDSELLQFFIDSGII